MGVDIDCEKADQMALHADALMDWARKINLTTIRNPVDVAVKHYLDSLASAAFLPRDARLLDVGSGGGFPGIPLKILMPALPVTLIDASRKKTHFLKHLIRTLRLDGIEVIHGRVESLPPDPGFGVVVSRAVTALPALLQIAVPLLQREAIVLAYKGRHIREELEAAQSEMINTPIGRGRVGDIFEFEQRLYTLPYLEIERTLVLISYRVPRGSNSQ